MRKVFYIIQREYVTRVRKKSFLITTLIAPIVFLLFTLSTVLIQQFKSSTKHIAIIDDSGLFVDENFADAEDGSVFFHKENRLSSIQNEILENEKAKYDAIILIPKDFDLNKPQYPAIRYMSKQKAGLSAQHFINESFSKKIQLLRAQALHLAQTQMDELNRTVKLDYNTFEKDSPKSGYMLAAAGIGYMTGFMIYIILIIYGTMLMKGVAEEKANRVVEIIASSVSPFQMMIGKIIGLAAVGLTQFVLWVLLVMAIQFVAIPFLGLAAHGSSAVASVPQSDVDMDEIMQGLSHLKEINFTAVVIFFLIYFIGGFLLYGSLFAAIGAATGDEGDTQMLTFPVTIPIIIAIMLMMNALGEPEGSLAFWGSIIPFTSPVVMPALIPFNPPWWQILLSICLLILGFLFCVFIAAKIYRTGILMYGKKVSWKEIWKWMIMKN